MRGNAGEDDLFGGPGNDLTKGKRRSGTLYGGPGNGTIVIGEGSNDPGYARDGE
jgi:Ca2+-binding RTX toxin-like protein